MKTLSILFMLIFATTHLSAQKETLKWLNKNKKGLERINATDMYAAYDPKIDFKDDKILVYTKEKKLEILYSKIETLIITTYPGGTKSLSVEDDNDGYLNIDCNSKCENFLHNIAEMSSIWGKKPALYERDMSKLKSSDLFGK